VRDEPLISSEFGELLRLLEAARRVTGQLTGGADISPTTN
jgi:hypothetical protein